MKLIFISHPYTYNPKESFEDAKVFSRYVAAQGLVPINPVLLFHYVYSNSLDYQQVMYNCFEFIKICAEVWVFNPNDIESHGVQAECAYAEILGKPIKIISISKEDYEYYKNSFIEN